MSADHADAYQVGAHILRFSPPVRSTHGSLTLADISRTAWLTVATQSAPGLWNWHLTSHDVSALHLARDTGRIVTVQRRVGDGFELWARGVGR